MYVQDNAQIELQSNLYIAATLGTWGTGRLIQDHLKYSLGVV